MKGGGQLVKIQIQLIVIHLIWGPVQRLLSLLFAQIRTQSDNDKYEPNKQKKGLL